MQNEKRISTYVDSVPLPASMAGEPWSPEAARFRLDLLTPTLPFVVPRGAEYVGGQSNDAWFLGRDVLRVCWRSDRGRLLREAHLLQELPPEIPHAAVTAAGESEGMSWILSPRLRGKPLTMFRKGELGSREMRTVYRQVARILEDLHSWKPSAELKTVLRSRPHLNPSLPMSVWAADLVPLPIERLEVLAPLAKSLPFVDAPLVDRAMDRIESLAHLDPFGSETQDDESVVHGDATTANIMVEEGHVTGLIDFEHVRMGPKDLELLSPILFDSAHGLNWLREDYPALFEGEHLRERLWLYQLCCLIRQIIWWPPEQEQRGDSTDHPPIRQLRMLVEAPTQW
jgi:aminoglycoside phosphotransferase (APT) family kinase protein